MAMRWYSVATASAAPGITQKHTAISTQGYHVLVRELIIWLEAFRATLRISCRCFSLSIRLILLLL